MDSEWKMEMRNLKGTSKIRRTHRVQFGSVRFDIDRSMYEVKFSRSDGSVLT